MNDREILLVEDSPDDAELTRIAFAQASITNPLVVVRDGAQALDYLFGRGAWEGRDIGRQPALMLLDLNLPKLDGRE
ncbi:MAG: response regulator, partial [Luteimonas sp.]